MSAALLLRRVGGVPWACGSPFVVAGTVGASQQRAIRRAAVNGRSRLRWGSEARAGLSKASITIQACSSQAIAVREHRLMAAPPDSTKSSIAQ
jgi:hypothetical protein